MIFSLRGTLAVPGFLLAFCARYDEASRLLGAHMTNSGMPVPTTWYEGYFFPMCVAYSAGLLLAFVAVILMEQGQPALLYICPICLAVMFIMGRHRLKDLWNGAKVFKLADGLISKNERAWGKLRMKRFMEKRKRESLVVGEDVSPDEETRTETQQGSDDIHDGEFPQQPRPETAGGRGQGRSGRGGPGRGDQRKGRGRAGPGKEQRSGSGSANAEGVPKQETLTAPLEPSPTLKPSLKDICFGNETHPGSMEFRRIVKMEVAERGADEEFCPGVFKSIRMKLKGRRFFKAVRSNEWVEASKLEIRTQVCKTYDFERSHNSHVRS